MPLLLELLEALQLGRRRCTCRAAAAARDRRPSSLLMTTRSAPVSMFVTVTVTPGSDAPLASVTVPSMVPLTACDCAAAGAASPSATATAITRADQTRFIDVCLLECSISDGRIRADALRAIACRSATIGGEKMERARGLPA